MENKTDLVFATAAMEKVESSVCVCVCVCVCVLQPSSARLQSDVVLSFL